MLETNFVVTQCMDKLCAHKIQNRIKLHKIVGIQIKLVHEISSQDLKLLVRNCCGLGVLIRSLVFICMCIHKLWNITLWVGTQHVGT